MADDRYRYPRDRYREGDFERGRSRGEYGMGRAGLRSGYGGAGYRDEDDGYIARRGFGNESAGFDRDRGYDRRYDLGRERDFGDSAGYGTGGSARDSRDVVGDDRTRGGASYGTGYDRERGYGGGYGAGPYTGRGDYDRSGSSGFGRGSREDDDDRGLFERAGDEIRSWFGDDEAERRRERDARESGWGTQVNRGRGPRNYTRSDERIREDVNDRLTDDPHIDASDIEAAVSNREVTLSGMVGSRFEKRHAEDLAESVSGVTHVQNNLRVRQPTETGMGGSALSGTAAPGATMEATTMTGTTGSRSATQTQAGTGAAGRRRSSTAST